MLPCSCRAAQHSTPPVIEMPHFTPERRSTFCLYSTSPGETAPAMFVFVDNATFPQTHLLCIELRRNEIWSQCRGEMPAVYAESIIRLFINHSTILTYNGELNPTVILSGRMNSRRKLIFLRIYALSPNLMLSVVRYWLNYTSHTSLITILYILGNV